LLRGARRDASLSEQKANYFALCGRPIDGW
jgi:hypothetical protein